MKSALSAMLVLGFAAGLPAGVEEQVEYIRDNSQGTATSPQLGDTVSPHNTEGPFVP